MLAYIFEEKKMNGKLTKNQDRSLNPVEKVWLQQAAAQKEQFPLRLSLLLAYFFFK